LEFINEMMLIDEIEFSLPDFNVNSLFKISLLVCFLS